MAAAVRPMIFVPFLEFQVGSCLYVTAVVKAASHFGKAQGDHSGQSRFLGSLEPVGALVFSVDSLPDLPRDPSVHLVSPYFSAELKIPPPFGEACVCHPWSQRDPFGFVCFPFIISKAGE